MADRLSPEETEKLLGYAPRAKTAEQLAVRASLPPKRLSREETASALASSMAPASKTKDIRPTTPPDDSIPAYEPDAADPLPKAQKPDTLDPTTQLGATMRGAVQGGTARFGDELGAGAMMVPEAVGRAAEKVGLTSRPKPDIEGHLDEESAQAAADKARPSIGDTYRGLRDSLRADNQKAQKAHPIEYGAAELGAGLTVPVPGSTAAGAGLAAKAGLGAAQGAGYGALLGAGGSNAEDVGGVAKDALVSAGLSAPLGAAGAAAGHGFESLAGRFSGRAAEVRAAKAAKDLEELTATRQGKYAQKVQDSNRALFNMREALKDTNVSDTAKREIESFLASPEGKSLAEQVAVNTAEEAPEKLAQMAKLKAERSAAPTDAAKATEDYFNKSTLSEDVAPRAKSYLARYLPSYLANTVDDAVGIGGGVAANAVGALTGAAMGKPGTSFGNLLQKTPRFSNSFNKFLSSASDKASGVADTIGPNVSGEADSALERAIDDEPDDEPLRRRFTGRR